MSPFIQAFLLFLPAGVANMTPIFAAHFKPLKKFTYPLDCNQNFRHKRIFGDHKTWRGLITGILTGTLTSLFFGLPATYGLLVSFGALAGDAVKSFFKRQMGVPSGKSWFPFDQVDFIFGGLLFSRLLGPQNPTLHYEVYIFLLYFFLHLISSFTGYLLKLKSSPI
jgi:CDP-2,3-bis-(O-geranylgeranyl)-sn-glycerol synthase